MSSQEKHILGQHAQHDNDKIRQDESQAVVPLREEELAVRKQSVETGRVSIGTDVVEEQQSLEVPVTREELTIDRHPVERRPADEPVGANSDAVQLPLHADQISVEKEPVVYQEVNVGKRAVQQTQRVDDTVRKEVMDLDATDNVVVDGGR
jgi:uncharacterized protein (TIGR02271 family)